MLKISLALLCFLTVAAPAQAQQPTAGELQVQLVLAEPGDLIYSRYGHVAIRVIGPGMDTVFNFGVTNFKRKGYVKDFLTGRVIFWGKTRNWERTKAKTLKEDRTLKLFPVNLTQPQARALLARLQKAMQPEHREYYYDTFRKNCSTILRDELDISTKGAVTEQLQAMDSGLSFRDDVRVAFAEMPGLLAGCEIVPGPELDAPRTAWEMTYRPAYLTDALQKVMIERDGKQIPLVGPAKVIYTRQGDDPLPGWPHVGQAWISGIAAFFALLAFLAWRGGWRLKGALLLVWLLPAILLGALLEVVAVGTDWPDMQRNALVAVFVSLDLWLLWPVISLMRRRASPVLRWARGYLKVRLAVTVFIVLVGLFWPALGGPLPIRAFALAGLMLALGACTPPRAARGLV
ncbi:MAG: DUF4105 domain-containing protein [Bradymonadia bacterium]